MPTNRFRFEGMVIGSVLDVPFSSGVISAQSQDSNAFNTDDVEMLKQVAEVFSVGLTRVKDLEQIEARVEELKRFEERSASTNSTTSAQKSKCIQSPGCGQKSTVQRFRVKNRGQHQMSGLSGFPAQLGYRQCSE